jgi:hypothetical protein
MLSFSQKKSQIVDLRAFQFGGRDRNQAGVVGFAILLIKFVSNTSYGSISDTSETSYIQLYLSNADRKPISALTDPPRIKK